MSQSIFKFPASAEKVPVSDDGADFANGGGHIFNAVGNVLFALGEKCGGLTKEALSSCGSDDQSKTIIGVLWFCKTNKGVGFINDALELCKADGTGVDGLLIVTGDDIKAGEVPLRESPLLCAHKERIQICKADLSAICMAVEKLEAAVKEPEPTVEQDKAFRQKLAQVAATYAVFQPIGVAAGHGARNDVANRILAPIRLLARSGTTDAVEGISKLWEAGKTPTSSGKPCWQNFTESLEKKNGFTNTLTEELRHEMVLGQKAFETAVKGADIKTLDSVAASADALMTLMTEYRRNAGIVTEVETQGCSGNATGKDNKLKLPTPSIEDCAYRLLVVDDHWAEWQPVVNAIKGQIEAENQGTKIEVFYSPDGKMTWDEAGDENKGYLEVDNKGCPKGKVPTLSIVSAAFRADAVLLDIMLGNESGLEVLKEIREYSESIPIILWTTTRSQEITNQAQQANGVILKKTTEPGAFAASLAHWLAVGRARRGVSLLNPFFDDVIKKPAYREYARDVCQWALKWMSGFHTAKHFRLFTDHGGRHFTKVLGYVEKAIHPLLSDNDCFSKCPAQREQEFLALYLAVFLHELGMFPIRSDEGRISTDAEYVKLVRTLHAPRGMMLIEGGNDEWIWADMDGRDKICGKGAFWQEKPPAQEIGNTVAKLRAMCAALVGYHARFLMFNIHGGADSFLDANGINGQRKSSIRKATDAPMFWVEDIPHEDNAETLITECLARIKKTIQDSNAISRLAKLAAILRVCDAIDKDETRNPPIYLSGGSPFGRELPVQDRETLKQMICQEVSLGDRDCSIAIKLNVSPPDVTDANNILTAWLDRQEKKHNGLSAKRECLSNPLENAKEEAEFQYLEKLFSCGFDIYTALFSDEDFKADNDNGLWRSQNRDKLKNGFSKLYIWQNCLEWWLDTAWYIEHGDSTGAADMAESKRIFRDSRWIENDSGRWTKTFLGLVCSMSGVFSVAEVSDEYNAFDEVGLGSGHSLRLGVVLWENETAANETRDRAWGYLQKSRLIKGGEK